MMTDREFVNFCKKLARTAQDRLDCETAASYVVLKPDCENRLMTLTIHEPEPTPPPGACPPEPRCPQNTPQS